MTTKPVPTDDLERVLRDHYRGIAPTADPRLAMRVDAALDAAALAEGEQLARARARRRATISRAAAVAAVVALVAAGILVPRLLPAIGPEASDALSGPTAPAGPAFDDSKALAAQVDLVGRIRSGGVWAIQSNYLLISTDEGATWKASHGLPDTPIAADVLDGAHAWAVSTGSAVGPTDLSASPSANEASVVVHRTTDAGLTWAATTVATDGCATATLSFVDAANGFLACRAQTLGTQTPDTTIFRTVDGGATWTKQGVSGLLGRNLVAADAQTLWAEPDAATVPVSLYASRDAGATWSPVPFNAADDVPGDPAQGLSLDLTPIRWQGAEGSFAVSMCWFGRSIQPRTWFWRTTDGGATWSFAKAQRNGCVMGGQLFEWALTGPVLGTLNDPLLGTLVISTDNGATWDRRDAAGLPADNPTFGWIDFADARHGAATVFSNIIHSSVLLVSANGGRSWLPVDLASARLHAPPDATSDASLAGRTASDFVVFTTKDPPSAWAMLSPFSQHAFGTESAFATAEGTRANRENYQFTASSPTQSASVLNATVLGQALWSDLQSNAVVSRAYAVRIDFPSGAFAWLVIAPMAATGELRVWVVDATG